MRSTSSVASRNATTGRHGPGVNSATMTAAATRDGMRQHVRSDTCAWHWHEVCGDGQRGLCEMGDAPEDGADDGSRIVVPHGVKDFG